VLVLGRPTVQRPQNDGPSVTAAILRRSRIPVLIAPNTHREYRRVLAGVDDSPNAPTVLNAAITIGDCFGVRIAALHVKPTSALPVLSSDRPRWLQRLEQAERGGGVVVAACETLVRQGDPATEILAEAQDSDLLVIGYRRGMILDARGARHRDTRAASRHVCRPGGARLGSCVEAPHRYPAVDRVRVECAVLGHEAQRPDLGVRADLDADADHTPHPDHHVSPEAHGSRFDDTVLHDVTREMNARADDHVVPELEQVVVRQRDAVQVHRRPRCAPFSRW
jgi:nucleotide-binding universal stress UspA family protein